MVLMFWGYILKYGIDKAVACKSSIMLRIN